MDITVKELKEKLDQGEEVVMIDVRESYEWEVGHIPGVRKVSLATIPQHLAEWEPLKDSEIVMICRSGNRSGRATQFLSQQGFSNVRNLTGGMKAWKAEIDPNFEVG